MYHLPFICWCRNDLRAMHTMKMYLPHSAINYITETERPFICSWKEWYWKWANDRNVNNSDHIPFIEYSIQSDCMSNTYVLCILKKFQKPTEFFFSAGWKIAITTNFNSEMPMWKLAVGNRAAKHTWDFDAHSRIQCTRF